MKKNKLANISKPVLLLLFALITGWSCSVSESDVAETDTVAHIDHPEWSKSANMYEVNIRQYTEEGTFKAFQEHLPRLKEMGVDILWLMPIHPIGKEKRKGELGKLLFY